MGVTPFRKIALDTNVYIGFIREGLDADVVLGPGVVRYLSAVVLMELRAGAITRPGRRSVDALARAHRHDRTTAPDRELFAAAGDTLRALRAKGVEVRRASLVNDVLIAHTARSLGACVLTHDRDFVAIRTVFAFALELLPRESTT